MHFKARNERIETGVLVKSHRGRKGRHWKEKCDNAISGKQLDSVQEETLAVFATEVIVDIELNRLLLLQWRRHRLTEESPRKALAPGEKVLLEGKVRKRAKNTSKELVTNPFCDC